jgi:PEGA domain
VHGGPQTIAFSARRHLPHADPEPETETDALVRPDTNVALDQPSTSEIAPMTAATDAIAELRSRYRVDELMHVDTRLKRARFGWVVAAVLALVAVGEGVVLGRLYVARAATPPTVSAPIALDSPTPGDAVIVNGQQVGVTPMSLTLTPDVRSVVIQARAQQLAPALVVEPTPAIADRAPDPALAAARDRRGGLRIQSPVEVQVLEGERVLGSSADGPIVTTAGRHELDFINTAVGYRSRQVVEIRAGQIVPMNVTMPDGRVSVNAVPWAQVFINGNAVGDTPLANLPLPVGEHQITFRHPQLGEQTQRVVVKAGALTRVSATLTR